MFSADDVLSPELSAQVEAEITKGEHIEWIGQPIPSRLARSSLPIVLFAIPWTAFAVFWVVAASQFKMPDFGHGFGFFPLFGVPFILIGLGMLSSPYWIRRKAARTVYVITDQRVIIVDGGAWRSVTIHSFEPARLTDLRRTQHPDGSGNLIFERRLRADGQNNAHYTDTGFMAIADVKGVEARIRELVRRANLARE